MSPAPGRLRETIINCLSEAQSGRSDEDQRKALRTLASITRVSPQYRSLVAKSGQGAIISTLLRLSSVSLPSASPIIIKTLSLSILFNLSLNPDLKLPLASMETIYCLNSIIESPTTSSSQETIKLASSLICSLAMLDKNKAKFGVAGTVQVLVKAISSAVVNNNPAAHHLLSSLAELVPFHGNSTLAVRSGAVPLLIQVIGTSNASLGSEDDLAGTSLAALSLLARFDEGFIALRKNTEQIVESMVEVLRGRSMCSKEGAADILLRMFEEEGEGGFCVRDALRLQLPELSTLLADLSIRGSIKARERATLLMKKITEPHSFSDPYLDNNSMELYQW